MIWLILLLALISRLINLNQSLWWDEAINVVYAQSSNFWWFVTQYPISDFHPPGYFAILWVWGHLFSFSEVSVRLPSVVFGLLTILLTYLIGKELISKKVGLLSALFLAVAPLHIYYSQEARMYSLAALAVTLSTFFLIKLIKGEKWSGIGYILSVGLLFYSDYLAYLIIPVHLLWIIIFHKNEVKEYFLRLATGSIFIIPWLLVFPAQLISGQLAANLIEGWKVIVGGADIKNVLLLPVKIIVGRINFDNNLLYVLIIVILGTPFLVSFQRLIKLKQNDKLSLLWFWLIIPPALALLISFFIPIFAYFRFIFILPAFYLLISAGIEKFNPRVSKILIVAVFLSGLISSSLYLFNPKFHREDWRGAINFVSNNLDDRSIALFEYHALPAPTRYYGNDLSNFRSALSGSLGNNLEGKNRIYFFEYLVEVYDPQRLVEQQLNNFNFINTKTYNFRGVGFIKLYEK